MFVHLANATTRHDIIFLVKFTNCLEQSNADSYCQSDIVSDFTFSHEERSSERGLSAGKLKIGCDFSVV